MELFSSDINRQRVEADRRAHPEDDTMFHIGNLPCRIQRHAWGHYCGYIDLPEDHPDAQRNDDDLDEEVPVHV